MILQIDAHIDWREERYGERMGFSSTMRRASEQDHVWRIVQAGMRGIGSAREAEVRDALDWGARLVTARDIHHHGVGSVLQHIPEDCDCVISFDCDALDLSQMPAVSYPTPGGLTYTQVTDLIAGVAAKARIAGFCDGGIHAAARPAGTAAFTAARIAANVIGRLQQRRLITRPPPCSFGAAPENCRQQFRLAQPAPLPHWLPSHGRSHGSCAGSEASSTAVSRLDVLQGSARGLRSWRDSRQSAGVPSGARPYGRRCRRPFRAVRLNFASRPKAVIIQGPKLDFTGLPVKPSRLPRMGGARWKVSL